MISRLPVIPSSPSKQVRIAFATTTYNRIDLVQEFVRTIVNIGEVDADIMHFIRDDCSTEPVLGLFDTLPWKKRLIQNAENLWVEKNTIACLQDCLEWDFKPDLICNLDSDLIFKPGWLQAMLKVWNRDRIKLGCLSGFNANGHKTQYAHLGVAIKESIGGAGLMFRAHWLPKIRLGAKYKEGWGKGEGGWDWEVSDFCRKSKLQMAALTPSVIQHMGRDSGVHKGGDWAEDF